MTRPVRFALLLAALTAWATTPAPAADMKKVLRVSSPDITSLDPQQGTDLRSTRIASHIDLASRNAAGK
jgi:ABC-type oligopeptide transport system substrate-binding subunit